MKRYQLYTFLCDCLSLDFHPERVQHIAKQLDTVEIPWERFVSLASNHFVLQTIYRIFKDQHLLEKIPEEVTREMQRIHSLIEVRNKEMISQSIELNEVLRKAGIHPVFTKGMGYIMQNLYKQHADRLLADVDVLVPFESLETAVRALEKNGFTHLKDLDPTKINRLKHYPRIFKPGSMVSFEVHWEPIKPVYRKLLTEAMVSAEKTEAANYPDCFTMSWKHAVQHNFIHSQLEHHAHAYAKVFLRNIYDLALLSQKTDINHALEALNGYQKQAASYIVLSEKTFNLENLSSPAIRSKASKTFLFRQKVNLHYRAPNLVIRLLVRIYHSYIQKFFRSFVDKELRSLLFRQLSSRSWYRHHINTYKKMFRGPGS